MRIVFWQHGTMIRQPDRAIVLTMSPSNSNRSAGRGGCLKSLFITLLLLAVGFASGVMCTAMFIKDQAQKAMADPHGLSNLIVMRMNKKLDLTDDQVKQVQAALNQRVDLTHRMLFESWPLVEMELDRFGNDIGLIMQGDQKAQWEQMYSDVRDEWFERPSEPPPVEKKGWF